jgi:hypothetical protein
MSNGTGVAFRHAFFDKDIPVVINKYGATTILRLL